MLQHLYSYGLKHVRDLTIDFQEENEVKALKLLITTQICGCIQQLLNKHFCFILEKNKSWFLIM